MGVYFYLAIVSDSPSFSGSKGDPYVELVVDGQPPRKTDIARKTWEPKWNEDFTM